MLLSSTGPLNDSPVTSWPEVSSGNSPSFCLHAPMPSKFSKPNPIGSIRAWQLAQDGSARCCSRRWRKVPVNTTSLPSFNDGTLGSGGGGGVPRIFSKTHLPRLTGEVRVGVEVLVSTL